MNEKSTLEIIAGEIRGKKFSNDKERESFAPKSLVGSKVRLLLEKGTTKAGGEYARITGIKAGGTFAGSGLYKRWVPDEQYNATKPEGSVEEVEVPF